MRGLVGALVQFVVDSIVLAGHYVESLYAGPVEAGVEDGLHAAAVGGVVCPGALDILMLVTGS
jgi:hypothetical protein